MQKIDNITKFLIGLVLLIIPAKAWAMCPVCTIAVGTGLGLSRWFGIDDTVTGLWIGGLMVSLVFWTIDWLKTKKIHFKFQTIIVTLGYFLFIVVPLIFLSHPDNTLWGIDKIMLGIAVGSIGFLIAGKTYQYLKKKNNNKAHFPFEKVVLPVSSLILLSIIFYLLTK
jgi:hypothetical protein